MLLAKIKRTVEESDTRAGRIFDLFIQCLIVLSLVSFSVETLPDLSESSKDILYIIEAVTVAIFTVEYLSRLLVADNKLKFIFSFYGLIDLAAILPFYIVSGIDLRAVRIFRLFRLIRILKIFRYSKAIQRFRIALLSIRDELVLFLVTTLFLLFIAAVGIYYFEKDAQPDEFGSVFHSLWWAVATLTTVGYGDVAPITVGGKIFTFVILLIGLGVVAVPAGLMASALTQAVDEEVEKADDEDDAGSGG